MRYTAAELEELAKQQRKTETEEKNKESMKRSLKSKTKKKKPKKRAKSKKLTKGGQRTGRRTGETGEGLQVEDHKCKICLNCEIIFVVHVSITKRNNINLYYNKFIMTFLLCS